MLMKAWLSALQRQFVRGSRNVGLRARRRDRNSDPLQSTEHLEERALLTALVINSSNFGDFSQPNEGLTITNADMVGFDSLVIESVAFGGVVDEAIDIDLSGINLTAIAIETVNIADYGTTGIDINLDGVTGLQTIAIEEASVLGDGAGVSINLSADTDVAGLTIDDSSLSGVRITADTGSDIGHGAIVDSRLTGGVGVEGILLQMDASNADNFHILNNSRISSTTRDAVLVDLKDAPQDGITIAGNTIGANTPVEIDFDVDGDTFTQPFRFTNPARNGEFVTRIFLDIGPAGLVFDEDPTTGKAFRSLNGSDVTTGLTGAIVTADTLELQFFDFAPGEEIVWEIDLDLAPNIDASITGFDMIGSTMTFQFSDGKVIDGFLVGVPGRADASMFSQTAGDEGANGIHIVADASPVTNLSIEDNEVSGTPGSSLIFDTFDRSDVTGVIRNNDFLSSGTDGVVFNMTDGNFQGGFVDNNVSGHLGHGLVFSPEVSQSGPVERVSQGANDSIVITSTFHQLETGDEIVLQGLVDDDPNVIYPGNGRFTITRLDNNRFRLDGTDNQFSNFLYDSGGRWYVPEFQFDGSARGLVSLDLQSPLPTGFVQAASNANPIIITSTGHGLASGDVVRISNVNGNTAANGIRTITVLDPNRFQLNGVAGNGTFDPDQGLGRWVANVVTAASNEDEIIITAPGHNLESRDRVRITGVLGNTAANGTHTVRRIDDDTFKLVGVTGNGDYLGDGNWLRLKQETITGDFIEQSISGNSFTSNRGAGVQVDLLVGTTFDADIVQNLFSQNRDSGLNIQSVSFGVGEGLPLDPLDPAAVPDPEDISFNVNVGTLNAADRNSFDRNDDAGIRIQAFDAGTGSFEIRNNLITRTQDDGDSLFAGDGIHIRLEGQQEAAEAVSLLSRSTIDGNIIGVDNRGNEGRGIAFSMEERTRIQDLEYTNNSVVNNGDDGFRFLRRDDARLNNVRVSKNTLENNAGDGADFQVQNTTEDVLDFRFDENDITNNENYGIRISVLADARIEVDLENNSVDFNGRESGGLHPDDGLGNRGAAGGIGFRAFQNVDIFMNMTGNRIVDNIGDGMSMDAENFFDVLHVVGDWRDNEFSRNTLSGVRNNGIAFGRFTWTDNEFVGNQEDGVRSITRTDTDDFFQRRIGGSDISIVGMGNLFADNAANGLHLGQSVSANFGDGSIANSNTFEDNGEDGLKITQDAGQFLYNNGRRRSLTFNRAFFRNNGDDGVDLGEDYTQEGGNLLHGDQALTQTDVVLSEVIIAGNDGDGIEYLADNIPDYVPVVGGGQDNATYFFDSISSLTVEDSSIRRNLGRGIDILNRAGEDSRVNIINNDILSNGLSGVYVVNTASRSQLQSGPSDDLVAGLEGEYVYQIDANSQVVVFPWDISPNIELRIQDNEIESNGTDQLTSNVPINVSTDGPTDSSGTRSVDWVHRTQQVNGTLGGVVVRVGTVDAISHWFDPVFDDLGNFIGFFDFSTYDPDGELGAFAGIDAEVFRNSFDGNFGAEVYFDNFTSIVSPQTMDLLGGTANFDCSHNPESARYAPQSQWQTGNTTWTVAPGWRDALSRFDLVFRENTGKELDVMNGFAFQNNDESEFKSRSTVSARPPAHNHQPLDPTWFHSNPGNRYRNQTRTLGDGGVVAAMPVTCAAPIVEYAFDGEGTSAWRVESDFRGTNDFEQTDETLGLSDFDTTVQLGVGYGEEPYFWDTGFTPWSLRRGDIFNVRAGEDPIQRDSLDENDHFIAATDLGVVGGILNVNSLSADNTLTIATKGDRDYYKLVAAADGTMHVDLNAVDIRGDALVYNVYRFDPDELVEEVSLRNTPLSVQPGDNDRITVQVQQGQTYFIEVVSTERPNQGPSHDSFIFGTTRNYILDIDAPGVSPFTGGGGGSQSGSGGSENANGGSRGSQPGSPSGFIEPITPDPRSTGVPLVEITFSEDVFNVDIDDFRLTRDGENIDLTGRDVTLVTQSDYTLDLSGITQEAGTYKLRLLKSDITDIDDNGLISNDNDTWVVTNDLTIFDDIPDSEPGDGAASDDDGNSSLRAAVEEANAVPGPDIINLPAGTYDLTRDGFFEELSEFGDLDITDDLTIIGAGALDTIIDAGDVDRIFHVFPNVSLTLSGVTLTNGEAHDGGIILNEGTLDVQDVNIMSGRAFNQGGGIYNTGDLYIEDSAIVMNYAGSRGGGIFNRGDLTMVNTTISGNTAPSRGAGIFNEDTLAMTNVTIAANTGGARGGGLANEDVEDAVVTLGNTIIADNTSDFIERATGNPLALDLDGSVTSRGHNLVGELSVNVNRILAGFNSTDILGGTTDELPAVDPKLAALEQVVDADLNGTFRHNLISGSPAIDAGDDRLYPKDIDKTDQIGHPRILDGNLDAIRVIDIGARERFLNRPVAFFTVSANPAGINELVRFDGSLSSHSNPQNHDIVLWEWDFDYDGVTFTVDATGETTTNRFPVAGVYTVALRVTDTNAPPKTDITTQDVEIGIVPDAPEVLRPFPVTSDSTPTIRWNSGAPRFDLRIRKVNKDGSTPIIISETDLGTSEYTVRAADDLEPGSYTVEVRGSNGAGVGDWSDPHPFKVKDVILRTPIKNEFDPTPEFRWTGVKGTLRYELFVIDLNSNLEVYRATNLPGDNNRHTIPISLPVGRYLARVTAYDQDNLPGDKSKPRRFNIVTPIPIEPGPVTVDPTPELRWTDVKAAAYEVQVEEIATGSVVFSAEGIMDLSISTTRLNTGDHRYRVRAVKENGEAGHWSPFQDFLVDPDYILELLEPNGSIADRTPLFDWTGVSGVQQYQFRIVRGGGKLILRDNAVTNDKFQLKSANKLKSGTYRWSVRPRNADGDLGQWSFANFQVERPVITAPVPPIDTRTPTIEWNGDPIFETYELRVDNVSIGRNNVIRERDLTDTEFTPDLPLEDATFRARVRGKDADGNFSEWSPWFRFTIDIGIDEGPGAVSPIGGDFFFQDFDFMVWRKVPSATSYELFIKEIRPSGQPIIIEIKGIKTDEDVNTGQFFEYTLNERLAAGRTWRWWVRGVNGAGEAGPYGAPGTFRTASAEGVEVPSEEPAATPQIPGDVQFVEQKVMVASLNEAITIHPALPAEAPVETTAVALTAPVVVVNQEAAATPVVEPETSAPAAQDVDSVMTEWTQADWWATEEDDVPPVQTTQTGSDSGGTDERLLLAAALPLALNRRRNRRRKEK